VEIRGDFCYKWHSMHIHAHAHTHAHTHTLKLQFKETSCVPTFGQQIFGYKPSEASNCYTYDTVKIGI